MNEMYEMKFSSLVPSGKLLGNFKYADFVICIYNYRKLGVILREKNP